MNDNTRRAIALITGSIVAGKNPSSVYDYAFSKLFPFSRQASLTNVNVYDYTEKCHITGSGKNGNFSLYHYGNSKHITLEIKGNSFSGYDHHTTAHYNGQVNGTSISVYDYQHSQHFNYSV